MFFIKILSKLFCNIFEKFKIEQNFKRLIANKNIILKSKLQKNKEYKYHKKYLEIAKSISDLSHAERKKVGSIIVKDSVIISDGYNGTPSGFDNSCEDENGCTKWYTLHAEANAILKLVKTGGISAEGSILYITLSPCKECAKLILQAGIKKVIYLEEYRDKSGVDFLKTTGLDLCQFIN